MTLNDLEPPKIEGFSVSSAVMHVSRVNCDEIDGIDQV